MLGHALPHRRTHPPSHISLDGLAVATHCSAPSSPLGDRNGEASTFLAEGDRAHRVHAALELLPEQQREVVVAVVMQGASQNVVSREMGLSKARVSALLRQGQRRLALLLSELREEQSAPPPPAQSMLDALDELQLLVAA